jgi:hypothetical protein
MSLIESLLNGDELHSASQREMWQLPDMVKLKSKTKGEKWFAAFADITRDIK